MKVLVTIIPICLAFFFIAQGCSMEEQPPEQKTVVKIPIKKPIPKEEPKRPVASEERKTKPAKKEVEAEEKEEIKTAAVEEKKITPPVVKTKEKETTIDIIDIKEKGYYAVKKGDSLVSIAGRDDVYGDPLKWPILYRLNMDQLGRVPLGKDFPDRDLPEGIRKLKIITPEEAKDNIRKRANKRWVVNVLSTPTAEKRIVPAAMRLMKKGYPVYITIAKVKGKNWLRLRVGFFKSRNEANIEGKKMMALLNLADSWAAKVKKEELEEFGRY